MPKCQDRWVRMPHVLTWYHRIFTSGWGWHVTGCLWYPRILSTSGCEGLQVGGVGMSLGFWYTVSPAARADTYTGGCRWNVPRGLKGSVIHCSWHPIAEKRGQGLNMRCSGLPHTSQHTHTLCTLVCSWEGMEKHNRLA